MSNKGFFGRFSNSQSNPGNHPSDQFAAGGVERGKQELTAMEDLLARLTTIELSDAIDLVMLGPVDADAQQPGFGFSRFAARLFSEVGASRIRSIAASHDLGVIRLSNTGTFWMRFPYGELEDDELSCVFAAEAAMNRLLFVKEAFESQTAAAAWSEVDCALADSNLIESMAYSAPLQIKGAENNPLMDIEGVSARKGGEWDVRTRFALAAEALRAPYRLSYEFDTMVQEGLFSIDVTAPLAAWLPQHRFDPASGAWVDSADQATQDAARYSLSICALLVASAFGTSVGIRRVRIATHPKSLDVEAAATLYVDRLAFVSKVLPVIEAHDISWMLAFLEVSSTQDDAFDQAMRANHCFIQDDIRPIPEGLQAQLAAKTVDELDVITDMPSDSWDSVHAAEEDRKDAPLAAIAVLEDVVAKADEAVASLPEGNKALYCSDAISRYLLPAANMDPAARYVRYSDSGFRARSLLCDLYCEMGEPERAVQQAEKCIELAPSSTIGYTDLVHGLFEQHKYAEAIPYLVSALGLATQGAALAFIYYRLAFALWQTERREAGLACYVMCLYFNFGRPDVVRQEMDDLVGEMPGVEPPTVSEAREILSREGLPLAPTPQVRQLAASALIPMVDSGIFDPVAPLARFVGTVNPYRDELYSVANSLQNQ